MDYSRLPTEKQNRRTAGLDCLPVSKILRLIDQEDQSVPRALRRVNSKISQAVGVIVRQLKAGGRLIFAGAGTSGRLGVLEAAECPPTFNTPPSLVQAVMAGGKRAVFRSQEGAEDRIREARLKIRKRARKGDVVVGISASGVTPFVKGALNEAKRIGAKTILVACNLETPLRSVADVVITPNVGPEIIAGSTRLKAGTATKLILNRLTIASMVQLGKVYGNWMVDLQPRSKKLKARAERLVKMLTGLPNRESRRLLQRAKGRTKVAILMARKNISFARANLLLKQSDGFLRKALR